MSVSEEGCTRVVCRIIDCLLTEQTFNYLYLLIWSVCVCSIKSRDFPSELPVPSYKQGSQRGVQGVQLNPPPN